MRPRRAPDRPRQPQTRSRSPNIRHPWSANHHAARRSALRPRSSAAARFNRILQHQGAGVTSWRSSPKRLATAFAACATVLSAIASRSAVSSAASSACSGTAPPGGRRRRRSHPGRRVGVARGKFGQGASDAFLEHLADLARHRGLAVTELPAIAPRRKKAAARSRKTPMSREPREFCERIGARLAFDGRNPRIGTGRWAA